MDSRQNKQAYNELFEVYKQDRENARGSRLKWELKPSGVFKARVYKEMETSGEIVGDAFQTVMHTLILKTPDRPDIEINDHVLDVNTGRTYIVVSISRDVGKSKFIGRYDKLRTVDTYITLRR